MKGIERGLNHRLLQKEELIRQMHHNQFHHPGGAYMSTPPGGTEGTRSKTAMSWWEADSTSSLSALKATVSDSKDPKDVLALWHQCWCRGGGGGWHKASVLPPPPLSKLRQSTKLIRSLRLL